MPKISIRKSEDLRSVETLDKKIFSRMDAEIKLEGTFWWLAYEDGAAVGFAGMRKVAKEPYGYFCRAGVLPRSRGQGIHTRLIRARLNWAKRQGWAGVMTYTILENHRSANNLINQGFRLFKPGRLWAGPGHIYFVNEFETP